MRVAVRTRWGELLSLLPFEGRKDDREGRPKARRLGLTPLERRGRRPGRCAVLIVLVLVFGWRDTEHTFWRFERGVIGRLGSRKVRKGCIEGNCVAGGYR